MSITLKRVADAMIQSSSTSRTLPSLSRSFHITSPLNETYKSRQARAVKKKNLQKRQESKQSETSARPDAVLGHSRNAQGEKLWEQSDLSKILLTPAKILEAQTREVHSVSGTIPLPEYLNFGIKSPEEQLVFRALPEVVSQQTFFQTTRAQYDAENPRHAHALEEAEAKATISAIHLARITDLRNASAAGIAAENRRRCVEAFSLPDKPNDTGRSEVQAAIWTAEIRNLASHLKKNTHDIHNRRSLRILVHKRAKILRYLRKNDPARYQAILPRLGLEAKAVEGELIVYGPDSK